MSTENRAMTPINDERQQVHDPNGNGLRVLRFRTTTTLPSYRVHCLGLAYPSAQRCLASLCLKDLVCFFFFFFTLLVTISFRQQSI